MSKSKLRNDPISSQLDLFLVIRIMVTVVYEFRVSMIASRMICFDQLAYWRKFWKVWCWQVTDFPKLMSVSRIGFLSNQIYPVSFVFKLFLIQFYNSYICSGCNKQQWWIGNTYGIVICVFVKYFKYCQATFISYAEKETNGNKY